LSYRTGYDPDHPNRVRVCVQRSPDGLHWTADKPEAVISFPKNMQPQPAWGPQGGGANNDNAQSCRGLYRCPATVYIHKRIEEHEAALYACAYGQFGKDGPWRNFLIRSDDRGKSWSFFADIGRKYEPDFCRLANGEMIAEGRCGYVEPRVLLQTRSTDGGRTWSQPVPAPGVETVSRADRRWFTPTGELFYECSGGNVDPVLLLMGNGVLALSYGRPGLSLRFSVDGTGNHWDHRTTILPKYAVTDGQPWAFPVGSHYCHSYSGMVPLSDCTFLLVSNIYGYSPGGDPHKGRDVVFVVPVSLRKAGRPNARPQLTGPRNVLCQPGREILVRFQLSDPDGDWVQLVCPDTSDVQIRGNAIAWRVPWEFKGRREITLVAEDAWAARSAGHLLTIRKAE